jgi:hypothetical protein
MYHLVLAKMGGDRHAYLLIPDLYEPCPIYEKVTGEFVRYFDPKEAEMLIYIEQDDRFEERRSKIRAILEKHRVRNHLINTLTERVEDEHSFFRAADCYITTRAKENLQRMCFTDLYNTVCVSGVDIPNVWLEKCRVSNYSSRS